MCASVTGRDIPGPGTENMLSHVGAGRGGGGSTCVCFVEMPCVAVGACVANHTAKLPSPFLKRQRTADVYHLVPCKPQALCHISHTGSGEHPPKFPILGKPWRDA